MRAKNWRKRMEWWKKVKWQPKSQCSPCSFHTPTTKKLYCSQMPFIQCLDLLKCHFSFLIFQWHIHTHLLYIWQYLGDSVSYKIVHTYTTKPKTKLLLEWFIIVYAAKYRAPIKFYFDFKLSFEVVIGRDHTVETNCHTKQNINIYANMHTSLESELWKRARKNRAHFHIIKDLE